METLDVRDPEFRIDPYPALARVREAGPVCRIEPSGFLGVTRYRDVVAVLKDPKTFSSAELQHAFPPINGAELFSRNSVLIGSDPPTHTRVRRLVQRAFTIQEMAAWTPKIEALTNELLDALEAKTTVGSTFDLIEALAMPLPVAVIAQMLGVDRARQADFKRWSDDMVSVRTVQISTDEAWRTKREAEIVESCREFHAYFEQVIAEKTREPSGPDLLSAMVRAASDGEILKPAEVLSLTRLMLVAGNETTTNLLGNAMTALLRTPGQWQRLVSDPLLASNATEETLRYDGPVIQLVRRATRDTEIAGVPVKAETVIAPLVAAADRDPRQFDSPDRFDIDREDAMAHIAFGAGVHLCVGAPLARIETRIALEQLARRFKDLCLADDHATRLDSYFLRGHKQLRLRRERPAGVKDSRASRGADIAGNA